MVTKKRMEDKYGNPLNIGDRVVYSTGSDFNIGVIIKLNSQRPTILTDSGYKCNPFPGLCMRLDCIR